MAKTSRTFPIFNPSSLPAPLKTGAVGAKHHAAASANMSAASSRYGGVTRTTENNIAKNGYKGLK